MLKIFNGITDLPSTTDPLEVCGTSYGQYTDTRANVNTQIGVRVPEVERFLLTQFVDYWVVPVITLTLRTVAVNKVDSLY